MLMDSSEEHKSLLDSSDEEDLSGEPRVFRKGPSRDGPSGIQLAAQREPGLLYQKGLESMTRFLRARGGPGSENAVLAPKLVGYLTAILHGHVPVEKMDGRDVRELRTIAEALDALQEGQLAEFADLLMQRFKSIEHRVLSGSGALEDHLELIPPKFEGLVGRSEQMMAMGQQYKLLKVKEATNKLKG